MRYGNDEIPSILGFDIDDSDPTYEVWKLNFAPLLEVTPCYSDPTYEVWKPR